MPVQSDRHLDNGISFKGEGRYCYLHVEPSIMHRKMKAKV